jgi:hypothetical protein
MIVKAIRAPIELHVSKSRALLATIVDALEDLAEKYVPVLLLKVVSHTGLLGNDMADEGAALAATNPGVCSHIESSDNNPFASVWWWRSATGGARSFLSDLNRALSGALHPDTVAGYSKETRYGALWREASDALDAKVSNLSLPTLTRWDQQQALKARWGQLYCPAKALLYGHGGDGNCPLCRAQALQQYGQPKWGSAGHILGGCLDEVMSGMYTDRHNAAVRGIATCLQEGHNGGGYMLMDAGTKFPVPGYVSGAHPPYWMLPGHSHSAAQKLRADILFIPTLKQTTVTPLTRMRPEDRSKHTVYLIEIGYTGDLRHAQKIEEKAQQHQDLAEHLRTAGWVVKYSRETVVTLGHTGTVTDSLKPLLTQLGAPPEAAAACCCWLHRHEVRTMGPIVKTYRRRSGGGMGG